MAEIWIAYAMDADMRTKDGAVLHAAAPTREQAVGRLVHNIRDEDDQNAADDPEWEKYSDAELEGLRTELLTEWRVFWQECHWMFVEQMEMETTE